MEWRRIWPVVRRIWITAGIGVTIVFVTWSLIAYRASDEARQASMSAGRVQVENADGLWRFTPDSVAEGAARLVFFPGALVDARAYAPLARSIALHGHPVTIVELPRRGAFGGAESAELRLRIHDVLGMEPDRPIVVAGHSRGAVVASDIAARSAGRLDGLALIGTSHPRDVDLSGSSMPVTKIVGTRDGLATKAEVEANASLLPGHTRWVWIEGGNHSQFGWYGFQPMDRRATVAATKQRRLMTDALLDLLVQATARSPEMAAR